MITNFISLLDFSGEQLSTLLDRAIADKALWRAGKLPHSLKGKTLAMIFEKPSLRTRVSFEAAMNGLGGHAIHLSQAEIGIGSREAVQDIARVLGRLCNGIMARTYSHDFVETMGRYAGVPVVNALTDFSHPCQAMADVMTIRERFGSLKGKTITFVGDGNNVARSLSVACHRLGMKFILACPKGYEMTDAFLADFGPAYRVEHDPIAAVRTADCVYTDTWVSMGQEEEKEKRRRDFTGYQLDMQLMTHAPKHAIILHCLPAYRGFEITDEALEAHFTHILDEAENRLHFQRTLLHVLMGEGGIR
jgi:ornithine carbamoyltransferase